MAQPAVKGLLISRPDFEISLLGPHWASPLYRGIGEYTYLPLNPESLHGLRAILNQVELMRRYKFDFGILLTPSFSSALAFYLARVKNRYGYSGEVRSAFLSHPVKVSADRKVHRSIKYLRLIEFFLDAKLPVSYPSLKFNSEEIHSAEDILAKAGAANASRFAVIAPQAVAESRRWGSANYAALSGRIISELGYQIVLLGAGAEFKAGEVVASGEENIINLCGKTDISAAGAILSRARLFIGNDSGLAHLAAAVNIPLVVLSGADDPAETSPLSDRKKVIIRSELDCISCVKNRCPLKGDKFMRCMREISVDSVFQAVLEALPK